MAAVDLDFDSEDLAKAVERLPREALDELPFGVVRLDADGVAHFFSKPEAQLSGYGDRPAVGLNFFTDIAPCMNTPEMKSLLAEGLATGSLDIEFNHIGDFTDREREVCVRVQSASDGGMWMFLRRR